MLFFSERSVLSYSIKIWRVVYQEHAYFTASLCNAGLENS